MMSWKGLPRRAGERRKISPKIGTKTLLFLSTVVDLTESRPAANTETLYPAGTTILLGSGVTGVRVDHFPAGPPGSAFARSCANADPDANPAVNASIAAYLRIFIFFSSWLEFHCTCLLSIPLQLRYDLPAYPGRATGWIFLIPIFFPPFP